MPQLRTILRNTPLFKIFLARQGSFARVARETIQTRTDNGGYTTEETADLMSAFVEAQKKHPDVVSDLVLNGYVTLPIYAGSNSVAVGLTSILYLLGKHPRVQEKLHKSLVQSGLPMPPPWSQISKLTYLEAVIRECFRYHPATALLSRRIVPPGPGLTLPDGRVLPPGTTVAVNGCVTHFHKETYGDDVHSFRPERWLRDDNESEAAYNYRLQKMHKADLTFGHGEWVCIGNNIAKCEIHKAVATLYSIFEASLIPKPRFRTIDLLTLRRLSLLIRQKSGKCVKQSYENKLALTQNCRSGQGGAWLTLRPELAAYKMSSQLSYEH